MPACLPFSPRLSLHLLSICTCLGEVAVPWHASRDQRMTYGNPLCVWILRTGLGLSIGRKNAFPLSHLARLLPQISVRSLFTVSLHHLLVEGHDRWKVANHILQGSCPEVARSSTLTARQFHPLGDRDRWKLCSHPRRQDLHCSHVSS